MITIGDLTSTCVLVKDTYDQEPFFILWTDETEICIKNKIEEIRQEWYDKDIDICMIDYLDQRLREMRINFKFQFLKDLPVAYI